MRGNLGLLLLPATVLACSAATPEDFFRAIRADDRNTIRALAAGAALNRPDGRGTTPLHYAAVYGSLEALEILVKKGADLEPRNNFGATPLILAASSPAKIRLLLAQGADPNASTKAGRTALLIAAGRSGSAEAVRLLLDRGARLDHADERGTTALLAASWYGDLQTVRLLLSRGARATETDKAGNTTLMGALNLDDLDRARLLLARGADVNAANTFAGKVRHGNIALTGMTALILACADGNVGMIRALLEAGARVNVRDGRGMTPLMAAVVSESRNPDIVRMLMAKGADVNAVDTAGDSVLDWASRTGDAALIAMLGKAGAKGRPAPSAPAPKDGSAAPGAQEAVLKSVALLQRSSAEFFKQSGCIGCHHQPAAAMAEAAAQAAGLAPGDSAAREQINVMTAMRVFEPGLLQFLEPGGEVDTVANALLGAAAARMPANSLTGAAVNYLAGKQSEDGSWKMLGISRPPFEDGTIKRTALAVRALRAYGWPAREAEFDERVARAREWLLRAEPRNTFERAELLAGLHAAGAAGEPLQRVAARLIEEQRADGGWAQTRHHGSDAYATGLVLNALLASGHMKPAGESYRRGVRFLLNTQLEDGSWFVRSRAPKFQPYFQSGFPHDHDQWISATATAYAAAALAPAAVPAAIAGPSVRPGQQRAQLPRLADHVRQP